MHLKSGTFSRVFALSMFVVLSMVGLRAQTNQGSLAGHVADSSGASVPHAKVSAREVNTGIVTESTSDDGGAFRLPALQLGVYDVSVGAQGFKTARYSKVIVQLNSIAVLNVVLQVGGAAEFVTVDGSAPSLQTESSDIGGVITTKQVTDLPLALGGVGALRSPEAFVFLQPGTVGPGTLIASNGGNGIRQIKIGGAQNQEPQSFWMDSTRSGRRMPPSTMRKLLRSRQFKNSS